MMDQPDTKKPSRPLPWIIVHLAFAALVSLFLIAGINTTGFDIIGVFFQTSSRHYPVLLFSLCGLLAAMNIILAACGVIALRKKREFMSRRAAGSITLAMAVIFLCMAGPYLRMHHPPAGPGEASAPERLWARIGPVVQFGPFDDRRADASSSMVVWYFDPIRKNDTAVLRFGREPLPEKMGSLEETAGDGRRHEFHLTGLAPSTPYYYQVPAWGDTVYSFRTGPARESSASLRFMAVGDTDDARKGGYAHSYLRDVMGASGEVYRDNGLRPDFLLHAGDMVRTGDDLGAWHNFFSSMDLLAALPIIATRGNHECLNDACANFSYLFGQPDYFVIDYGGTRLFSIHPFDGPGETLDGPILSTGRDQYRWLKRELGRGGGKWVIVIIHVPILSSGDYGTNELLVAQYFELFRRHQVDLVISGHDHNFDSFHVDSGADWGGTVYLVTGTGGSRLDSYIMDRNARRWLDWRHDRNSPHGLYQEDDATNLYHVYGELSWGFTDVEIRGDVMTATYYRWLDFEKFLQITGQKRHLWDMPYIDGSSLAERGLLRAMPVKQIIKRKRSSR